MNAAFDIDGLADSFPRVVQSMMSAFTAAGHHVYVITGIENPKVTAADVQAKKNYLSSLGIGPDCYTDLIVCPEPHDANKAAEIQKNNIAVLFDNSTKNCKKARKVGCAAFLLTNSKEK